MVFLYNAFIIFVTLSLVLFAKRKLFATIFVSKGQYMTLPVGVQQLFGQYTTDWGPIGAALAIATIPTMIVYALLSKRIQAGFIAGAVKG